MTTISRALEYCACPTCRTSPSVERAAKRIRRRLMRPRLVVLGCTLVDGVPFVLLDDPTKPHEGLVLYVHTNGRVSLLDDDHTIEPGRRWMS
jgi:hypothetical protein